MKPEEIEGRFEDTLHRAHDPEVRGRRETLHSIFRETAFAVAKRTQDGRELSLVLTKLEEGLAWALKGAAKT